MRTVCTKYTCACVKRAVPNIFHRGEKTATFTHFYWLLSTLLSNKTHLCTCSCRGASARSRRETTRSQDGVDHESLSSGNRPNKNNMWRNEWIGISADMFFLNSRFSRTP
ncbi:hypothetical protein Y032_0022g463 [Ancylostoma ceylanicum]|uniref:Uncharacterized protein n=1 Tax=Ancylostoma ceylanicum TaxID=53326 RepID=A0A016UYP8_9BILA|nr:hypothetical protein Y032_0022g463 [Ancylostoma ceylanicum]